MAIVPQVAVENNFINGLKTEATGLNFPEHSCTDTQNCFFSLIGDATRREGYGFEANNSTFNINRTGLAMSSYRWKNAGGDGQTEVLVQQVGGTLYFYKSSAATSISPLSTTKLASTITISTFVAQGGSFDATQECQYSSGNGYLFVFQPTCDPFYCSYNAGTITGTPIPLQIRDFYGIIEPGVQPNTRPTTLTAEHTYNLQNQGWVNAPSWSSSFGNTWTINNGPVTFTINTGLTISGGQAFSGSTFVLQAGVYTSFGGTVTSYTSGTGSITLNVTYSAYDGLTGDGGTVQSLNSSFIQTWFTAVTNYPSNSDVWWQFKLPASNTGAASFPTGATLASQINNFTANAGQAPQGYYILNAFNLNRGAVSGISGLTTVSTNTRPRTGAWYAGRVFYAGSDSVFPASGDASFYTWTENIYFSQISTDTSTFGLCYENNDPTSETLFNALSTDGGVITIPGTGAIYKLFPLKFGILVFASNGIWYIAGSTGIGFTAEDYAITKISSIQCTSGMSFVDVQGYPMFWNNEGIYYVTPSQQGGSAHSPDIALDVNNLCLGSILTYYQNIPLQSIKFARGDFHQLDYVVQWCFRSTNESSVTDRYQYDTILNYNIITKAFYPYKPDTTAGPYIHDIKYIQNPNSIPAPIFKYWTSYANAGTYTFTYSEENNTGLLDWPSFSGGVNYISYFVTNYVLPGKGFYKHQLPYIYTYWRNPTGNFIINSRWDHASSGNSGKWSVRQVMTNSFLNFTYFHRRHRLRGRGMVNQIMVQSQQGQPFDCIGWAALYNTTQGTA